MINRTSYANYMTTLFGSLSSDELQGFNQTIDLQEINNNDLTPKNGQIATLWRTAYQTIYYANVVIENLQVSPKISLIVKQQLIAECKFIRAYSYFYLINFFGDVPLVTSTDYSVNSFLARKSTEDIYDFIISELVEAKNNLPSNFLNNEKVRPNKWAAGAILARVYLFRKDWLNAELQSSEIINSGAFTPLQQPGSIFLKNSKEAIWQLMPNTGQLPEINQLRPNGSVPRVSISSSLMASFESGDLRKQRWIDSITYQSTKYYFPSKYKNTNASTIVEYYMVLRIAEQYLIRSESRFQQNKFQESIADLNIIRSRAGLPNLPNSLSQIQIHSAIEQERRVEFFSEWATRWFDLKRTNKAATILSSTKPNFLNTDLLYPIPLNELLFNYQLVQNPGY